MLRWVGRWSISSQRKTAVTRSSPHLQGSPSPSGGSNSPLIRSPPVREHQMPCPLAVIPPRATAPASHHNRQHQHRQRKHHHHQHHQHHHQRRRHTPVSQTARCAFTAGSNGTIAAAGDRWFCLDGDKGGEIRLGWLLLAGFDPPKSRAAIPSPTGFLLKRHVRPCICLVFPLPSRAKTLPLPCVSTGFAAKTLPLPRGHQVNRLRAGRAGGPCGSPPAGMPPIPARSLLATPVPPTRDCTRRRGGCSGWFHRSSVCFICGGVI